MNIKYGPFTCDPYGPGVTIELTGEELATAIDAYLVAREVRVNGPRTVTVNNKLCLKGEVIVDPSGDVIYDGRRYLGRGPAVWVKP